MFYPGPTMRTLTFILIIQTLKKMNKQTKQDETKRKDKTKQNKTKTNKKPFVAKPQILVSYNVLPRFHIQQLRLFKLCLLIELECCPTNLKVIGSSP